jgi:hypothetical protein
MNGFLQAPSGNNSSSRLMAFIIVMSALVFSASVIVIGFIEESSVLLTSVAAGTLFMQMATPALFYMFNVKKEENKLRNENNGTIIDEGN